MALSKNFTLPEKCKNHWRALRESNIDQTVFTQNCLEVVLFLRETGVDCFWAALCCLPAPEARGRANSCGELSSLL